MLESHNSLGKGERCHDPLRSILQKIRFDNPVVYFFVALRVTVKAMNNTVGPDDLLQSFFGFWNLAQVPLLEYIASTPVGTYAYPQHFKGRNSGSRRRDANISSTQIKGTSGSENYLYTPGYGACLSRGREVLLWSLQTSLILIERSVRRLYRTPHTLQLVSGHPGAHIYCGCNDYRISLCTKSNSPTPNGQPNESN